MAWQGAGPVSLTRLSDGARVAVNGAEPASIWKNEQVKDEVIE